jgi:uncharacterized OsmC-like protein
MATSEQKMVNNIDMAKVEGAVQAIQGDAEVGKCKFRIHNKWIDAAHNHSVVGDFYAVKQENRHQKAYEWDADEPPVLAGHDLGPNPVEHLLNALAACVTTAIVYHAAVRGIKIDELESDLEGDLDLKGLFGMSTDVRPGFQNIRMDFRIRTDEENIEKLKAFKKFSPVYDMVTNGTNVEVSIHRK